MCVSLFFICTVWALQAHKTTGTAISTHSQNIIINIINTHLCIKSSYIYTQFFGSVGNSPVKNTAPQSVSIKVTVRRKIISTSVLIHQI